MYKERIEDLSVYYFVVNKFSDIDFIHVEDGYPEGKLLIPTIAVEGKKIDVRQYEIGNRDGIRVRRWNLDIYAKNKSQRDEFGYRLLNELKNGIPVYNYNEGFPPSVTPSRAGSLIVLSMSYDPIVISADVVEKLYYRATVSFVAENNVISEV